MFKHNLLIAFRNFKRFKSSFFINLTGLSHRVSMCYAYLPLGK